MGTIKKGSFSGFSGKVGNVVGATWKGIEYIRSRPSKVNDPKTKGQVTQRSRFSVSMDFLRTITPLIRIGFQQSAIDTMTAFNAAMSHTMKFGVKKQQEVIGLDFPNILVSQGPLHVSSGIKVEVVEGNLQARWSPDFLENARPDDIVMIVAYNPARRQSVYDVNLEKRAAAKAALALPPDWKGDGIETFLAFKTADGAMVSDSVYTGHHVVG